VIEIFRILLPVTIGTRGEDHEPRNYEIFFNPTTPAQVFDQIRISIASPEKILSWSYGEIKKPETIKLPHLQALSVTACSCAPNWRRSEQSAHGSRRLKVR